MNLIYQTGNGPWPMQRVRSNDKNTSRVFGRLGECVHYGEHKGLSLHVPLLAVIGHSLCQATTSQVACSVRPARDANEALQFETSPRTQSGGVALAKLSFTPGQPLREAAHDPDASTIPFRRVAGHLWHA